MRLLHLLATLSSLALSVTAYEYSIGVKNGYPGVSIWATLYAADPFTGAIRTIVNTRCLKSGEEAILSYSVAFISPNVYVRAELKQQENCGGDTLAETTVNGDATPSPPNWVTLLPQANFGQIYWTHDKSNVAPPIDSTLPAPVETVIFSRVRGGQSIALSVDTNNPNCRVGGQSNQCGVIIDDYRPGNPNQIWLRQNAGNGYLLTNKATQMLAYVANGNGNRVMLLSKTSLNMIASLWTIGGNCQSNCALRPLHDGGQNLNVFGDGPYGPGRAVGTWGWGGGDINETWFMTPSP